jgi:sensor c-di-GMP phosphodiesterase-like protein
LIAILITGALMRSTHLYRIAVILLCVAGASAVAHFSALWWIEKGRLDRVADLNDVALRRSEASITASFNVLKEIIAKNPPGCESDALQVIRLSIYQRGSIKDIRVADRDGSIRCSAYAETLEFDLSWPKRNEMIAAAEAGQTVFRVDQFNTVALGLMQDYGARSSLVAIMSMNSTLFDIMPNELLGHSAVMLELSDGQQISGFSSLPNGVTGKVAEFSDASSTYPIKSVIRIDQAAYEKWDQKDYPLIVILGALIGLASGGLAASLIGKSSDDVAEIDRGLAAREFVPYCQPIFDLATGEITGCEVLVRWIKDGMVIPPSRFIEIAEKSGRVERMTWQILEMTLRALSGILSEQENFKVSFNVTPRHLTSKPFVKELIHVVETAGVERRNIVVEVTERDEIENPQLAAEVVARLRQRNFRVAIDDVGIGHSGLSQIQLLGADIIKIDKFFIDLVSRDPTAPVVIQMLVKLAAELGMAVVAEGIESMDQVAALRDCGITEGQGYVVAPPLPIEQFLDLVRASPALLSIDAVAIPRVA